MTHADKALHVMRLQQEALRLLVAEAEVRLGMHPNQTATTLDRNRVFRAGERLDEAEALLDDLMGVEKTV